MLQRLPADFQQEPLLRIHAGRLQRCNAKKLGVEAIDLLQKTAGTHIHLARHLRPGVVIGVHLPTLSRNLRHRVNPGPQQLPKFFRGIRPPRQTTADPDQRNRIRRSKRERRRQGCAASLARHSAPQLPFRQQMVHHRRNGRKIPKQNCLQRTSQPRTQGLGQVDSHHRGQPHLGKRLLYPDLSYSHLQPVRQPGRYPTGQGTPIDLLPVSFLYNRSRQRSSQRALARMPVLHILVAQEPPEQFARPIFGQLIDDMDLAGHFEFGKSLAAKQDQFPCVHDRPRLQNHAGLHLLAQHRLRNTKNRRFCHCRMLTEPLFDLGWVDLDPTDVDHVFDAVDNVQITVCVQPPYIAGVKTTTAQHGRTLVGALPVTKHTAGSLYHHLPQLASRHSLSRSVDNLQTNPCQRPPHRTRLDQRFRIEGRQKNFGQPIPFLDRKAATRLPLARHRQRQRSPSRQPAPHRPQPGRLRLGQQYKIHRRNPEKNGRRLLLDGSQHRLGLEV